MKLVSQSSLSRITPNRSPSASNKINRARRACAASRDCPRTHRSNSCRSASFNLIMSIKHLDAFHTLRFTSPYSYSLRGENQTTNKASSAGLESEKVTQDIEKK